MIFTCCTGKCSVIDVVYEKLVVSDFHDKSCSACIVVIGCISDRLLGSLNGYVLRKIVYKKRSLVSKFIGMRTGELDNVNLFVKGSNSFGD